MKINALGKSVVMIVNSCLADIVESVHISIFYVMIVIKLEHVNVLDTRETLEDLGPDVRNVSIG